MRIVVKVLLAVVGLLVLVFGAWTLFTLNYTYSSGERAGYIQKISLKGWICKTWEGELAMANLPGAMPQIFTFTVRDDAIAHQIEQLAGQRVGVRAASRHPDELLRRDRVLRRPGDAGRGRGRARRGATGASTAAVAVARTTSRFPATTGNPRSPAAS